MSLGYMTSIIIGYMGRDRNQAFEKFSSFRAFCFHQMADVRGVVDFAQCTIVL